MSAAYKHSLLPSVCAWRHSTHSYPDFASIPVPLAPLPGARSLVHSASTSRQFLGNMLVGAGETAVTPCELGPSGTVTVHGVTLNVLAMQENLVSRGGDSCMELLGGLRRRMQQSLIMF